MFKLGDDDGNLENSKSAQDEFTQMNTSAASLKSALDSIANIFTSNLAPSAEQVKGTLLLIDKSAAGIAKSFGQGRENIQQLKIAMSDAYSEVARMGGKYSDIAGIQGKVAADLGRNVILQSNTIEKLFATQQVTGQNAEVVTKSFKDAGMSALYATEKMGDVVNIARSQGVNAQAVSKLVVDNMKNLNMYTFQGGVDGLAKMAAQATSMRFSMAETLKFGEKVFNPEGAIETAAALQRLGVTQSQLLDPLRLMDLAQNDPTELQNQLVEMSAQFVQLNKDGHFEILPDAKRQLREISKEMGISYDELVKMSIGSAELNDKMGKIRFPGNAFTDEQQKFIANMSEMGSGGEYKLRIDGEEIGLDKAMDMFAKDKTKLDKFMEDSRPKSMEELAIDQLDTLTKIQSDVASMSNRTTVAMSSSKIGEDILGSVRKMSGVPAAEMEKKQILTTEGLREDVFDAASKLLSEKLGDGFSLSELDDIVVKLGTILFDYGKMQKKKYNEDSSSGGDKTVKVDDFILKTHPMDSIVFTPEMMVGGTNLFGGQQNGMTETKNTNDININVTLTSNGADLNQLTKKEVLEPLVAHIQKVITGDGLLNKNGSTPNPIVNFQY